MNQSIRKMVFGIFLSTTIMACAPGASFTGISVAPFGEQWKIQLKDQAGAIISETTYSRGNQSLSVDEFEIKPNSGVVTVFDKDLKSFVSGKLTLPKINLGYSANITEIRSESSTGVAMFVPKGSFKDILFVFPDNTKKLYDPTQTVCILAIKDKDAVVFTGRTATPDLRTNANPPENYMPVTFTTRGTCSLEKLSNP
jgi:hypothetical protein